MPAEQYFEIVLPKVKVRIEGSRVLLVDDQGRLVGDLTDSVLSAQLHREVNQYGVGASVRLVPTATTLSLELASW